MELFKMTGGELHRLMKEKKVSAAEVAEDVYARISKVENGIGAYITPTPEEAIKAAEAVDKKIAAGEEIHPLAGIPIGIKDNICTKDIKTTCASRMLENFVPPYDATVITKLKAADFVMTGKLNMDEFAMGSSCENSAFHITHNPHGLDKVPGGSSGGSAAAVAAGEAVMSLGSDTGGSIRQPAAFCGVTGIKPTYGRCSRYGIMAFASSLDQAGPIAKDVRDCALLLNVMAGYDEKDSTSVKREVPDFTKVLGQGVKGLKVGVPAEYRPEGLDAEVSSNLARYDGLRYGLRVPGEHLDNMYANTRSAGFGIEVKRRIMIGTYVLSAGYYDAYYLKAQKVRRLIRDDFVRAFEHCDVILTPTAPTAAFPVGDRSMRENPINMWLNDVFTVSVNLAGLPGLSLPAGLSKAGLPLGLQLIGRPFDEETVFKAASVIETETGFERLK